MLHRWLIPEAVPPSADRLRAELGMGALAAKVLAHRGLGDPQAARRFLRAELSDLPPRCGCGGMLRPGVVWFGETLPEGALERAAAAVRAADILIVAGTSAQVYPAAGLIRLAAATIIEINPEETAFSGDATLSIRGTSAEVLPKLLDGTLKYNVR